MPSFQSEFERSKGQPIAYKGKTLYLADFIPVKAGDVLEVKRVSTNSEYKQAVILSTEGKLLVDGEPVGKATILWEDTAPEKVKVTVKSTKGFLIARNAWQSHSWDGRPYTTGWVHGAAMMIEEIPGGRRYYCNDGHPDENFDDIVFEIVVVA